MSVSISFISIDQHDLKGGDFDSINNETQQIWREKLDLVEIQNVDDISRAIIDGVLHIRCCLLHGADQIRGDEWSI